MCFFFWRSLPGSKPPGSNSQSTRDSRCNKSPEAVSKQKFYHGFHGTCTKGSLLSRSLLLREIWYVNVIQKKTTSTEVFEKYQEFHDCRWCYPFLKKKVGAILQVSVSISILSLGEGQWRVCLSSHDWQSPKAQVLWRENPDLPFVKVSVSTPKKRIQNIHKGRATMHPLPSSKDHFNRSLPKYYKLSLINQSTPLTWAFPQFS